MVKKMFLLMVLFAFIAAGCNSNPTPSAYGEGVKTEIVDTAPYLRKGPYLLYPGGYNMTVLWQLDTTQSCTLEWGTDTSYSTGSVVTTEHTEPHQDADHQHKYTITDLLPGQKYYYKVTVGAYEYPASFRSAPAQGLTPATKTRFTVGGDTQSYWEREESARRSKIPGEIGEGINAFFTAMVDAYTADPNWQTLHIHQGDWTDFGRHEGSWEQTVFSDWSGIRQFLSEVPINGCYGNHDEYVYPHPNKDEDNRELTGNLFKKYWPYPFVGGVDNIDSYFSFEYGPAFFAILDEYAAGNYPSSNGFGATQLAWLVDELQNTDKEWKFIVHHQSAYVGDPHYSRGARKYIKPIAEAYGVDVVIAGHRHMYNHCKVDGVHWVNVASSGSSHPTPCNGEGAACSTTGCLWCNSTDWGFGRFEIDANVLNFEFVLVDGSVEDSWRIVHTD